MFLDKDSIIVNNMSFGQYLVSAKFGYHKIWGKDTGRTLSFKMTGTLGGIFPKITMIFRNDLSKEDFNKIVAILDSESQIIKYDDPNLNRKNTIETYTGDYEVLFTGEEEYEEFSCSFISREKRK